MFQGFDLGIDDKTACACGGCIVEPYGLCHDCLLNNSLSLPIRMPVTVMLDQDELLSLASLSEADCEGLIYPLNVVFSMVLSAAKCSLDINYGVKL